MFAVNRSFPICSSGISPFDMVAAWQGHVPTSRQAAALGSAHMSSPSQNLYKQTQQNIYSYLL